MWNKITSYLSAKSQHLYAFMAGIMFINVIARLVMQNYVMAFVDFVCFGVLAYFAGLFSKNQ
jgi:hypothetical protein